MVAGALGLVVVGAVLLVASLGEAVLAVVGAWTMVPDPRLAPLGAGAALLGLAIWQVASHLTELPASPHLVRGTAAGAALLCLAVVLVGGPPLGRSEWLVAISAGLILLGLPWVPRAAARLPRGPLVAGPSSRVGGLTLGRWEPVLVLLAVSLFAGLLIRLMGAAGPFGHDESAYALRARAWVADTPTSGYGAHRGPLLPLLTAPIAALTAWELPFRAVGLTFAVAGALLLWLLGRRLFGPAAGLVAAATFATLPSVQRRAVEFLTDLPAAVLLTAVALLLWRQLEESKQASWWLLATAPLAAAAFYLRYGSILPIGLLALVGLMLWWRQVIEQWPRVLLAAEAFLVLLVPHVLSAVATFGTPWGTVVYTGRVAGRSYLGQGLVDYGRELPTTLAGPIGAALMLLGLFGGAVALFREQGSIRRAHLFLLGPAVLHILLLGIVSHGEPRFIFFPVMLLLVAGDGVVSRLLQALGAAWRPIVAGIGLVVLASGFSFDAGRRVTGALRAVSSNEVVADAGRAIARHTGSSCAVLTSYAPQITWYSGCSTYVFDGGPPGRLPAQDTFVLLFERGKRQPAPGELDGYLAEATLVEQIDDQADRIGDATLYRLASPGDS